MVILIDANILLDVLMNRSKFVEDSSKVWKLCETEQLEGYISALTFANLGYVMRKELTPEAVEKVYQKMKLVFRFTELSPSVLEKAVEYNWEDFEDALQSATAEQIHADYIITRNIKDFTKSKIPAFTPTEFLMKM